MVDATRIASTREISNFGKAMVPRIQQIGPHANYSRIPRLMQSLTLNADVEYDGPSLEIPAEKLFDSLPQNILGGEFLFTPDNLNMFNTTIWTAFQ